MVAQRYAQALYDEAADTSSVTGDMELIRETLDNSVELQQLVRSPIIQRRKKSAILHTLFGERVHAASLRFLEMLVQRGRESLLPDILGRFQVLSAEAQGITNVHARVYSELSSKEKTRLQEVLSDQFKRTVRLEITEEPALMGGIVLEIGDMIFDGSVRHQLSLLQDRLQQQA